MQQLCAGEATAWLRLMDHWSPHLYTYVLYQGLTEAEAQTLLHAIFAELVQNVVGQLRITNLTVLLFSIASQQVLNYCRQKPPASSKPQPPALAAEATADHQRLLHTLRQFTPEAQQVILLYYLYELPLPEIAQIVRQPEEILTKVLYRFKYYLP